MEDFWPLLAFEPLTEHRSNLLEEKRKVNFQRNQQRMFWELRFRLLFVLAVGSLGWALFKDPQWLCCAWWVPWLWL